MSAALIRGAWVLAPEPIRDGAVAINGDRIAAVGPYAELAAQFPGAAQHAPRTTSSDPASSIPTATSPKA
jgi:cytosine/adenosine deaminase-related metal-dependent hydrolase